MGNSSHVNVCVVLEHYITLRICHNRVRTAVIAHLFICSKMLVYEKNKALMGVAI